MQVYALRAGTTLVLHGLFIRVRIMDVNLEEGIKGKFGQAEL